MDTLTQAVQQHSKEKLAEARELVFKSVLPMCFSTASQIAGPDELGKVAVVMAQDMATDCGDMCALALKELRGETIEVVSL
jgi:hypothetical protein